MRGEAPVDEREAVARLQRGDIGGLEVLVRRYQLRAVRAAYGVTRDRALAEDVVQAAFIRAYERIDQFDPARPFGPWFLRAVLNDAIKVATRRERQVPIDALDESRAHQGPDVGWEAAETAGEVWAALGALPPAQRAVLVQRYVLGLSEAEMAAAHARPPGTIKSRLHAARGRLRTLLRPVSTDGEIVP
jgi:RNA polymerase sigma-70 factor (ECF subfamily)